jgi:hypothetical protein
MDENAARAEYGERPRVDRKPGHISQEIARLLDLCHQLQAVTEHLGEVANDTMRASTPRPGPDAKVSPDRDPAVSPLANQLDAANNQIAVSLARIREYTDRIDL